MAEENFELVDRDYENCIREEYPRQTRTYQSTHNSILQKFTDFRISLMKEKLDNMKNEAVTDGYTLENYDKKLAKKSKKIAKLEEKIMLLAKESVPTNYVSKRAIKLKKKMCANLRYTTDEWYTIGIDKKEEIFKNEALEDINVLANELDRDTIEDTINHEFTQVEQDSIDREDIEDTINHEFVNLEEDEVDRKDIEDSINQEFHNLEEEDLNREEIEKAIEDQFADMHQEETPLERYDIEDTVNEEFHNLENEDELKEYTVEEETPSRIFRNNSSSARISRYDEDGNERRIFDYTPMTDEEIRQSQIKLGFDEHGNLVNPPGDRVERKVGTASFKDKNPSIVLPPLNIDEILIKPEREIPVVVKEREYQEEKNAVRSELDDYNSLREKILYLKQQKELSEKQKEEAEESAKRTAQKAKEVKEMFEESEKSYAASLDMLRQYSEELERICDQNRKVTEDAENDARMNNDFISTHTEKLNENKRIIGEIDTIIKEDKGFSR
jgi:hypothetical protein